MTWIDALILGILQGLAEFLPISSSGHLEIGKVLLGVESKENMLFTVVVHGATVLSTIVVFRNELLQIFKGLFEFKWNSSLEYTIKIVISMLPILVVGMFFKEEVESLFDGDLFFVGAMLIVTALLLGFTYWSKEKDKSISYLSAFIIGISQAIAVLPGLSRSGSTIATGLLLKNNKEEVAKFSFLMVLVPIIGANLMDLFSGEITSNQNISAFPLIIGFISAFIVGLLACKWMIALVKRGKLIYFGIYCLVVGIIAIATA